MNDKIFVFILVISWFSLFPNFGSYARTLHAVDL